MHNAHANTSPRFTPVVARPEAFLDAATGLMWGAADVSAERLTYAAAIKAAADYRGGGFTDWRLPTIEELESLRDRTRYDPAADPILGLKSNSYWSSSPAAWAPQSFAWNVDFHHGSANFSVQAYTAFVRAVRVSRASQ